MVFTDARLKIERANQHIADIKTRLALLHATDIARVDVDPETGNEILKHEFGDTTAFNDIALMIGDTVHNLKCALDYTWLQTIEKLAPSLVNNRAKFPVWETMEKLEGWMTNAGVNTASPNLFRFMLDSIKPCNGGDNAVWPIHNLDIRDKHRLLIPVLSSAHIEGIVIVDQNGERWPGNGTSAELQLPPYIIHWKKGLHVKEKGKLTANIVVKNGKAGYFIKVPETLAHYSHFILRVVESFEAFLESQVSG